MWEKIKSFAADFFVTGDPLIYGADVSIVITIITVLFVLTFFKKWGWLWREWLTTVDHKKSALCISSVLFLCCSAEVWMRS